MSNMNWKTWLVIVAVAMGGLFELLKRLPATPGSKTTWLVENLRLGKAPAPYNVHRGEIRADRTVRRLPKTEEMTMAKMVTGAQIENFLEKNAPAVANTTEFEGKDKGAEGKPDKTAKKKRLTLAADEEWEYFQDPTTGKWFRRKVKKALPQVEPTTEVAEEPARKESTEDLLNEVLNSGELQTNQPVAPQNPTPDLAEWIRLLLDHADVAQTRRFVELFKSRDVSSDIFYKIVDMMIEDSRAEIRDLALICLGGAPPSLMSFNVLAEITRTQPGTSKLRSGADILLNQYTVFERLGILERVMRATTIPYNTVLATQKFEMSAHKYLKKETVTAADAVPAAKTGKVRSYAGSFKRFVVILEKLAQHKNESIKSQAASTLEDLNALLGPDTAPVNPTVAASGNP